MIKKTVLPNGVRIITEHMPESYSATVMAWIDAGSFLESSKISGISHFIEHLLFKGTKTRSAQKIVQEIEDTGSCINAFTEKEFTCYYAKTFSDKTSIILDILLDMVFNSTFREEDIKLEKQVILEEIKMYEDTPDELVHDMLIKSFWPDNTLSAPITGTAESVAHISYNDIIEFVENFYTPDNIVISIAGKFNEEEVLEQIEKTTAHLKSKRKKTLFTIPTVNPDIITTRKDIEQSHICIGMRGLSILNSDRYASSIIDISLGGGMTSRLFQEIREKRGLAYSINTFEALYRPAGIFGVYAATNHENINELINIINYEIEKYRTKGISNEEFQRSIVQLKGSLLIGLESTKFRASRNGRSELYFNRTFEVEEICNAINRVTYDDITRLSNYIFDAEYSSLSIVSPKKYTPLKLSLSC